MEIGQTLRQLRRDKNLSQVQVCGKLKISQTYLSQVESGNKEPSGEMMRKICKYYKVPVQVVVWQSMSEEDVQPKKLKIYRDLKPAIDGLISELLKSK